PNLMQPFAHPRQTKPRCERALAVPFLQRGEMNVIRYPFSCVLDSQCNLRAATRDSLLQLNPGCRAAGMPPYVCQGLLNDAKQDEFHIVGNTAKVRGHLEINVDTGSLGKTLQIRLQRQAQPAQIEQRRMKEIGDGADFGDCTFQNALEFCQERCAGWR